jgi:hypothetical protein
MQVKILFPAEQDLADGYFFYEGQSHGLGSYFLDSIYSDIDALVYFGGIHSLIFGYHRALSKRFPYAIYYHIIDDIVSAVLDCRRKPRWIRKKLVTS